MHNGVSEPPRAGQPVDPATYKARYQELLARKGVPFWPDVAWRDAIVAAALCVVVLLLAIAFGPKELGLQADPTIVNAYPRPDWYFLWLFALLALSPPALENWLIVGLPLLAIVALIALPLMANAGERSPRRRPWAVAVVGVIAIAGVALTQEGDQSPWSPDLNATALPGDVVAAAAATGVKPGADAFARDGCLSCHAIAGTGGRRGPDLSAVGDRLSPNQLTWRILNGGHNMPPYGSALSSQEVNQLVAFLASQRAVTPGASPTPLRS